MTDFNTNLVAMIRARMDFKRVQSKRLASSTEITEERLSTLLNCKSPLRLGEFLKISKALDLNPARMLTNACKEATV